MIVRFSFEMEVPEDTLASIIKAAGNAAACAAENTVERAHDDKKGAPAGQVRITIVTNKSHRRVPR